LAPLFTNTYRQTTREFKVISVVLIVMSVLASILVNSTDQSLAVKNGVPAVNLVGSWLILATSVALLFSRLFQQVQYYRQRLLTIFLAFAPIMIMLTISYESLFYASFFVTLLTWLEIERAIYENHYGESTDTNFSHDVSLQPNDRRTLRHLNSGHIRLAIQFLFYINVAFFGTGNIASVSSFTLASVYRLMTVFSPFAMGGLLVLKILIPFFVLSAVFGKSCISSLFHSVIRCLGSRTGAPSIRAIYAEFVDDGCDDIKLLLPCS
jgi:phosphatidylinositol glycan class N